MAMKSILETEVSLAIQLDGSHQNQSDQGGSLCRQIVRLQSAG